MIHTKEKYYTIYNASCLDVMDSLPENSIDAIVTDPPYEIGFMSRDWDNTGIAFQVDTWEKALRVLKPGGHILAFNHSRTFHRMAVAIEDAGFEIRDTIMWLYGSGFPKSHDISKGIDKMMGAEREITREETKPLKSGDVIGYDQRSSSERERRDIPSTDEAKQWQGWGSALKPSYEPIILARKPLKGTLAQNTLKYGVGGINIDGCRVKFENESDNRVGTDVKRGDSKKYKYEPIDDDILQDWENDLDYVWSEKTNQWENEKQLKENLKDYFMDNIVIQFNYKDYENILIDTERKRLVPLLDTYKNILNSNSMFGQSNKGVQMYKGNGRFPANTIHDGSDEVVSGFPNDNEIEDSASRFFYTAKASKKDRDEGLLSEYATVNDGRKKSIDNPFQRGETPKRNIHPTVKPTDLMQYLVRLISPKGSTILDPFMGSGSTGKAVMIENNERDSNYHFIGIDLEKEYCDIAKARIEYGINYKENKAKEEEQELVDKGQTSIFDFEGGE